jgi:CRP/FNR family transcriptional regulator
MVSPELLRRYPFFAGLDESQLKTVAMLAEEVEISEGTVIFKEGDAANAIYLLLDGSVDLYYISEEEFHPKTSKKFAVGEINVGEAFGISALIEPYTSSAEAHALRTSRILRIDALALRALFPDNLGLAFILMSAIARTIRERMAGLRAQLAAAWS